MPGTREFRVHFLLTHLINDLANPTTIRENTIIISLLQMRRRRKGKRRQATCQVHMTREWGSQVSGLGSHIAAPKSGLEENSIMTIITARNALLNRL